MDKMPCSPRSLSVSAGLVFQICLMEEMSSASVACMVRRRLLNGPTPFSHM